MKRLLVGISAAVSLLATSTFAADLPVKAPVYKAPPPVFSWTGFHAGVNIGYSGGHADNTATIGRFLTGLPLPGVLNESNIASNTANGALGGGQVGYNWLLGLETDLQAQRLRGSSPITCVACSDDGTNILTNLSQGSNWFGTFRGRAGILASPDTLFYATGGVAFGDVTVAGTATGNFNGTTVTLPSNSTTRVGWTAGAGVTTGPSRSNTSTWTSAPSAAARFRSPEFSCRFAPRPVSPTRRASPTISCGLA